MKIHFLADVAGTGVVCGAGQPGEMLRTGRFGEVTCQECLGNSGKWKIRTDHRCVGMPFRDCEITADLFQIDRGPWILEVRDENPDGSIEKMLFFAVTFCPWCGSEPGNRQAKLPRWSIPWPWKRQ